MNRKWTWSLLPLLAAAGGCNNHLSYVYNASFGVEVTPAVEGTSRIVFGYDAETYALVPKYKNTKTNEEEAMTLVSLSNVEAEGLDEVIFNHFVATGAAGDKAVDDPEGLKMVRKAVFNEAGK